MPPSIEPTIWVWLSPHETRYQTIDHLVSDMQRIHLPGHQVGVLIPTLYDNWPQQVVNRSIGDELAIDSADDAGHIRQLIEEQGILCGGWSVPRGTGDISVEGRLHGEVMAQFDHFVINYEDGWDGFWTQEGRSAVDAFLGSAWGKVEELGRQDNLLLGVTFVTNTAMLQAVSPDEGAAWLEGTHYVAIEAYVPGDPGLDPALGTARMQRELEAAGHPDVPIVCILEQGDLPVLCQRYTQMPYGVQVWTVGATLPHVWPEEEPVPEPMPTSDPVDQAWLDKKPRVVELAGEYLALADQLEKQVSVTKGNSAVTVRKTAMQPYVEQIRQRAKEILS